MIDPPSTNASTAKSSCAREAESTVYNVGEAMRISSPLSGIIHRAQPVGTMKRNLTKPELTLRILLKEALVFAERESTHPEPSIFGVTDGKAVGTYLEHKFQSHMRDKYTFPPSNSAKGIDFPELDVDIKVTSVKQPQSSCPFKSGRQKIFGLGYSLLVFEYDKKDESKTRTATLNFLHTIFVEKHPTADYQTTSGIINLLKNNANEDDLLAFMSERMLPVDDIQARQIAKELLKAPPILGYLTISNALQWRLQYGRAIAEAGKIDGVVKVR